MHPVADPARPANRHADRETDRDAVRKAEREQLQRVAGAAQQAWPVVDVDLDQRLRRAKNRVGSQPVLAVTISPRGEYERQRDEPWAGRAHAREPRARRGTRGPSVAATSNSAAIVHAPTANSSVYAQLLKPTTRFGLSRVRAPSTPHASAAAMPVGKVRARRASAASVASHAVQATRADDAAVLAPEAADAGCGGRVFDRRHRVTPARSHRPAARSAAGRCFSSAR